MALCDRNPDILKARRINATKGKLAKPEEGAAGEEHGTSEQDVADEVSVPEPKKRRARPPKRIANAKAK